MRRIERVERTRLQQQLERSRSVAARELDADDPAVRFAAEQRHRDAERLQAALEGRRPSAVFGRDDPPELDDETVRRELARHEAAHAADNALVMLARIDPSNPEPAAIHRAARWILRLDLELADVPNAPTADASALALALLRTPTHVNDVHTEVQRIRTALDLE